MRRTGLLVMAVLLAASGCEPDDECPRGHACEAGLTLDVRTHDVSGSIWHAGVPATEPTFCGNSHVRFVDTTGRVFKLGMQCAPGRGWTFSGWVYPGTYRVEISLNGEPFLPNGSRTLIPALEVRSDVSELRLDIPSHRVSVKPLLNGSPIVDTSCPSWRSSLFFHGAEGETWRHMADPTCAGDGSRIFVGHVFPGTYQVTQSSACSPPLDLPCGEGVVLPALQVRGDLDLTLDVRSHTVSGRILHDGAPITEATCGVKNSTLVFRNTSTRKELQVPLACDANADGWSFAGPVYPGTYEIELVTKGGATLPVGSQVLQPSLQVQADLSGLTLDVTTVAFSTTLGGLPLGDTSCSGSETVYTPAPEVREVHSYLDFEETTTQRRVRLPIHCSTTGPWSVSGRVYPGTYRVVLSARPGSKLPSTPYTLNPSLEVKADTWMPTSTVIGIPVGGSILRHGEPIADRSCGWTQCDRYGRNCRSESSFVDFVDLDRGLTTSIPIQCGASWGFHGLLYKGNYQVRVRTWREASVHGGTRTVLPALEVAQGNPGLVLDLRPSTLSGTVLHNGDLFADDRCGDNPPDGAAYVTLREVSSGDELNLRIHCPANEGWKFQGPVYPGTYEVLVNAWGGPYAWGVLPAPYSALAELRIP